MHARIYVPTKSTMQSGRGKALQWVLQMNKKQASLPDDLMGWCGSGDTEKHTMLHFDTLEQATLYAKKNNISYTITPHKQRTIRPKSYAANFAANRKQPWTH